MRAIPSGIGKAVLPEFLLTFKFLSTEDSYKVEKLIREFFIEAYPELATAGDMTIYLAKSTDDPLTIYKLIFFTNPKEDHETDREAKNRIREEFEDFSTQIETLVEKLQAIGQEGRDYIQGVFREKRFRLVESRLFETDLSQTERSQTADRPYENVRQEIAKIVSCAFEKSNYLDKPLPNPFEGSAKALVLGEILFYKNHKYLYISVYTVFSKMLFFEAQFL